MKTKLSTSLYILLILGLFLVQLFYTLHTLDEIRLEELSESVRNVYWLQNRTIYDGISSNVGWYFQLLTLYKIFGFKLFYAKFYRLGLHFIFLICLTYLLRKHLGNKIAWLPLIIIGFSPTLIYFNMLQTSFGIDLQYYPILLSLLLLLDFKKKKNNILIQILLWSLAMLAAMSYPSFLPYLPVLLIIYLYKTCKIKNKLKIFQNIMFALLSFFAPLIGILFYLRDPALLIYDKRVKSGLFRGGGINLSSSLIIIIHNIIDGSKQVIRDLFIQPSSYYFDIEIIKTEISYKILIFPLLLLIFSLYIFIKVKKSRFAIFCTLFLLLSGLVLPNISNWYPGLRRSTAVIAAYYSLIVLILWILNKKFVKKRILLYGKAGMYIFCILIAIYNIKSYYNNLLALNFKSPHARDACFNLIPNSPQRSLAAYVKAVQKDQKIVTLDKQGNPIDCRLHEIYAAIAGSCYWNHLNCPKILGYDGKTKDYIQLSTKLWEDYYFQH